MKYYTERSTMCFRHTIRLVVLTILAGVPAAQGADVLTYHNDVARTGQNLSETILVPANVKSTTFGRLFTLTVDGNVDAQPLVASGVDLPGLGAHNVLIVATENDSLYGFDADNGTALWHVSLLKSGENPSDDRGCGQVSPQIGITSTPVIDKTAGPNGTIYAVSMSKDSSGNYYQRLHALDLTSGKELLGGPVTIEATYPGTGANNDGNGHVVFDPKQYKERAGLLLLNGVVYLAFASHCDDSPYTAWVMGYNEYTLKPDTILDLSPNGQETSVWQAGAGPAADNNGNIYLLLANGTFDTNLNSSGFPTRGDYGNAFMKLSTPGTLQVADYFTMYNTVAESSADEDLGSGGALVLPDLSDSTGKPRHLAVGAGKDSNIYVVDRDNMGKFNPNNNNQVYQLLSGAISGGVWSMPAFFNGTLYYGSVGDNLKAFPFANGLFAATASSKSKESFGYPGTTPSISASGASNGIVWASENSSTAVLHAYDATNLGTELYNSNQAANGRDHFGSGNKYITPTIANGKVYVGTANGVGVFGILPATAAPVISSSGTASAVMGTPFSYQITATNGPTSFGATPLPAGLAFNSATGVIAGIPTAAGVTNVSINASNSGGIGLGTVAVTVTDPCTPVLTPAANVLTNTGGSIEVSVTIDNGCGWSASTDSPSWISFSGGSGTGNGSFSFSAGSNTGQTRVANISAGARSFKVLQDGSQQIFGDVPAGSANFDYITLMYQNGVTAGCQANPLLYCPTTPVTRNEMATFVIAALEHIDHGTGGVPPFYSVIPYFQDEPATDPMFPFVQRLADLGITNGCQGNPPLFCPALTITRGEMAKFMIIGWMNANNLTSFTYTQTPYFTDVASSDIFFSYIQKVMDLHLWSGCTATTYCENNPVSRADMAPMVMRSLLGMP